MHYNQRAGGEFTLHPICLICNKMASNPLFTNSLIRPTPTFILSIKRITSTLMLGLSKNNNTFNYFMSSTGRSRNNMKVGQNIDVIIKIDNMLRTGIYLVIQNYCVTTNIPDFTYPDMNHLEYYICIRLYKRT